MKKLLFISIVLLIGCHIQAQFIDDMESYTDGQPISGGHWTDLGCGGGAGCAIMSSSGESHSGTLSGLIPDDTTTDAVLDLGNKISSIWHLDFWMYVPSDNEASWSILSCVPICTQDWRIDFFFNQGNNNPGVGLIHNTTFGDVFFDFPHDEWFWISMKVDISLGMALSTWQLLIDEIGVLPCQTPFTNELGEVPFSLGGIEFFSISANNTYYVDQFIYTNPNWICTFGIDDNHKGNILIYPNPVTGILTINNTSSTTISSISVYDLLGRLVMTQYDDFNQIDVSSLDSGLLFVEIETEDGIIAKKIIKE